MDFLLGCDEAVAGKDRLYRALDKALEHRDALIGHLQKRWSDLFGAECQILLYDLTSTYFEGEAEGVESAARGYSRDHRPDTLQVVVALVVTPEGFPVAYEVFDGDTADVTTLEEIVDKIENKYGMRGRVWVFDRGIVSEDNLQDLRQRGAFYLVGTPRHKLSKFERELLEGDWQEIAGKPGVRVQLLEEGGETFVLARSLQRAKKESAILRSQLTRLHRSLRALSRIVARGGLKDSGKIERRLGRLEERYPQGWSMLSGIEHRRGRLLWSWNKARLRGAKLRQGAYLLRTNLDPNGSRRPLASICAAYRSGSCLSCPKKRAGHPSDLAPHPASRRGPYLSGLPGLLLVGLPQAEAQSGGRIYHPGSRPGESSLHPDGGGLVQPSRWWPTLPAPHH